MIRQVASTGSTNDDARAWAAEGAPHGAMVSADHQTAARGRLGRRWETPVGANLALSIVVRRPWPPAQVPWTTLAAAVAVAEAAGPAYRIKWPNDVLSADGRKVAGILAEAEWVGGRLRFAVVGIGVNVAWSPPDLPHATCLNADGAVRDRLALRDAVHQGFLAWLERPVPEIAWAWEARAHTLGRRVRVGDVEGVAEALLPSGGLRVRRDDGTAAEILAGDVEMVGAAPA